MNNYVNSHINQVKSFCNEMKISFDKLMACPKCYTKTTMFFQVYESSEATKGLQDEKTAKILLKISRADDKLIFEPYAEINILQSL